MLPPLKLAERRLAPLEHHDLAVEEGARGQPTQARELRIALAGLEEAAVLQREAVGVEEASVRVPSHFTSKA